MIESVNGDPVAKKRRMTVDELLGPELTAELGIEEPEGSGPAAPAPMPSEAPTVEQPVRKKPAPPGPAAKAPPKPEIQDEVVTEPTSDDAGFSDGLLTRTSTSV